MQERTQKFRQGVAISINEEIAILLEDKQK